VALIDVERGLLVPVFKPAHARPNVKSSWPRRLRRHSSMGASQGCRARQPDRASASRCDWSVCEPSCLARPRLRRGRWAAKADAARPTGERRSAGICRRVADRQRSHQCRRRALPRPARRRCAAHLQHKLPFAALPGIGCRPNRHDAMLIQPTLDPSTSRGRSAAGPNPGAAGGETERAPSPAPGTTTGGRRTP